MSEFNHRFMVVTIGEERFVVKYRDNLADSAILHEFLVTHWNMDNYSVQFRTSAPNSRNVVETWEAIGDGDNEYFYLEFKG